MESRRRFRPRVMALNHAGTVERSGERPCGWPFKPRRAQARERSARGGLRPDAEFRGVDTREKLGGEHVDVRTVNRHRWARRAASGERVKRGQGTRHTDPVTSEEGMPGSVRRLRSASEIGPQ